MDASAPLSNERLREYRELAERTTDLGASIASPGALTVLIAEIERLRSELDASVSLGKERLEVIALLRAELEQQKKLRATAEGRHLTASERADAARAKAFSEVVDEIVGYCPDHGNQDTSRMSCACEVADEFRSRAAQS